MDDRNPKSEPALDSSRNNEFNTPVFSAILTPYRSLDRTGFLVLMGAVSVVCFGLGILFASIGAWPIFGFLGLDVALIWFAFRLNYRSARAYEEIRVNNQEIILRRTTAAGRTTELRFNTRWVQLEVERCDEDEVARIALRSHGRETEIGAFLNPADRTSFAGALTGALGAARSGQYT